MNIRQMPLEELELLSYADIAYELLKSDKKTMTTPILLGEICKLLQMNEDAMFDMIGDFYTALTTDKRFILLENSEWDLKEFHVVKAIIDEEDDEEVSDEAEAEEVEGTEDEAVMGDEEDFDDLDDDMDDLEDLAIVTEDELEEE